jgi:hypothetical protein
MAAGDISAIMPYLKALDRLDRYQTVATANQVYDDEARKKLMDKINRMAENFGIDEDFAAAVQAHLKPIGEIPDDEPVEAEGEGAEPEVRPILSKRRTRLRRTLLGAETRSGFLLQTARNPLKRLIPEK